MKVDPEKAKYKTVYKGKIYYFCSKWCMEEFEKEPEYHLKQGPKGMPTKL